MEYFKCKLVCEYRIYTFTDINKEREGEREIKSEGDIKREK